MELFNAEQSSTYCYGIICYNASRGIDGDDTTLSFTAAFTGTHWWEVSMTDTIVSQIVLKADTYDFFKINVLLYNGMTQVGACDQHSGEEGPAETLSCDEPVTANRVDLTFTSDYASSLSVYEIKVTSAAPAPMGKSDFIGVVMGKLG